MNKNMNNKGGQQQENQNKNGSAYNNNNINRSSQNWNKNNNNNNNNNYNYNGNNNGYSNQQAFMPAMSSLSRTGISEIVLVPTDLAAFVGDPQFLHILLKIKEQSQINFINIKRNKDGRLADSILIDAPNTETALIARKLVEIHLKQQSRIFLSESRLTKVQGELFSAQGDMASGMIVDFLISTDIIGLVIGKKGARISMIEKLSGVTSVCIDGVSGKITVTGPDATSVQKAREMLELIEHAFDLKREQIDYLASYSNGALEDIKNASDLVTARFDKSTNKLIIIGTQSSINSAKMLLNVQLEYINKEIIIQSNEKAARDQLFAFKKQYNMHQNNYNNNRNDSRPKNPPRNDNKPVEDNFNKMSVSDKKVVPIENKNIIKSNKNENGSNNNNNNKHPKEVVQKSNTKVVNVVPVVKQEAEVVESKKKGNNRKENKEIKISAVVVENLKGQPKKKEIKNKDAKEVSSVNVKTTSNNDTKQQKSSKLDNAVKVDDVKKLKESNNNNKNNKEKQKQTIVQETPKVEEKVEETKKKNKKPIKSNETSPPTEVKSVVEKVEVPESSSNEKPVSKQRRINKGKKNTDKNVI
jgi:hypothetical protein